MIITISGAPGSGKSSVGKEVAQRLRYRYISIGEVIREEAKKQGKNILELMKDKPSFASIQRTVEKILDNYTERDNTVIDGRDAFYHVSSALKVFLVVDPAVAAKRIFDAKRETEGYSSVEAAQESIEKRRASEEQLYKTMHSVNVYDTKHYNLVIDTTHLSIEEVAQQIVDATTA